MNRSALLSFLRQWTLPIAMLAGAASYFLYMAIPALAPYKAQTLTSISILQPLLLFCMLFVSFCKVDPTRLRPRRWHLIHLCIQGVSFVLLALLLYAVHSSALRISIEGLMICMICPTATASAVITQKLGGDIEGLVTYTLLINLLAALLIPAIVPMVHPQPGHDFINSFWLIMGRVFPMLICPFFVAIMVRYAFPHLHARVIATRNLAFYMWAVSLGLAIAVSTKSAMHAQGSLWPILGLAVGSLLTCVFQFWAGRRIGTHYGCRISSSQALGQKATVFAIWASYTFLDPLSSLAGGFYSIWHNLWNTYQLRQMKK